MNHGPAWVLFEESFHERTKTLVSILSPRRTVRDVADYVEQLHMDRTGSIEERLRYKKSRKSAAYQPLIEGSVIHCGHEPFLTAIYATKTRLRDNTLHFTYRIIAERGADITDVRFEEREQSIDVHA
jgi:hypothetical protein